MAKVATSLLDVEACLACPVHVLLFPRNILAPLELHPAVRSYSYACCGVDRCRALANNLLDCCKVGTQPENPVRNIATGCTCMTGFLQGSGFLATAFQLDAVRRDLFDWSDSFAEKVEVVFMMVWGGLCLLSILLAIRSYRGVKNGSQQFRE